jgi:hypothetical protein
VSSASICGSFHLRHLRLLHRRHRRLSMHAGY